jgi:hypothetical protein
VTLDPDIATPRLRSGGVAALRLLETCPLLPIDAFVPLVRLRSFSAGYQQLARLRRAGLAEVSGVNLGYLLGDRRVGLWRITAAGIRMLRIAGDGTEAGSLEHGRVLLYGAPTNSPRRASNAGQDLALLVAGYRLLATLVDERCAAGEPVAVHAWERRWVRPLWSPPQGKFVQTRFPAAAVLVTPRVDGGPHGQTASATTMLLIPDLGTAPVSRYRTALRRLLALRTAHWESGSTACEPELVIVTPDPDGRGTRAAAWAELLHRVARRQGEPMLRTRILGWESVAQVVGRQRVPGLVADESGFAPDSRDSRAIRRWPAAMRGPEQVLQVVGRHPFLTADQRVDLLGTTAKRLSELERQLADGGWLRCVSSDELPEDVIGLNRKERRALRFVEVTPAGRRRLAELLALDTATASRYHGLIDSGAGQGRRRARLFRALPHTLGVNAVFVAMSVAAQTAARQGGGDELIEWRSAAACERRRCKPDGYGCYRRSGVGYGFLLEYDRGTEPGRRYAAKFGAYYRYRDSGDAARDFNGFPTLLFVTTDPIAEPRIADQAFRAWLTRGTDPLPVLITTTERIVDHREGILGPIWRTPAPAPERAAAARGYWLPGGPPRGLFGTGREPVRTPRLVWPTAADSRLSSRTGGL